MRKSMYPLLLLSLLLLFILRSPPFCAPPFCSCTTLFSDADLLKLRVSSTWSSPSSLLPLECLEKLVNEVSLVGVISELKLCATHLDDRWFPCPLLWCVLRFVCGLCWADCWLLTSSRRIWYFRISFFIFSSLCSHSFNSLCTVWGSPRRELFSYTPFIFIRPSRAPCSCTIFCWISWIFAINFFFRCDGGKSLKSSFEPSADIVFCE